MEVRVQGTDMDPSQYDPRDWTQVLRAQANLRETRNASHGTNADPSVRETPSQWRETPQTATTPRLQSSSTQLRVLHTTAQKIKQLPPLPPDGFKVVFRSQGGLDLTTLQPRYLLTALMQAAALTDPSTPTRRIHPVNNTCTVSAVNEKDALKLVQLQHITYDKHEYAMTAYIAPPDGSVRGVITNAYWKESPQELLADLISRNPHETILDARRMGLTRSILITFGQATVPRKIVYGGGLHLCTPYTPRVETCSNCRTIGRRTDVCIQPRTHRCPRCGQLHPKEANPTCTPVCIICEGPHLSGTRECKHRHLPKVTRPKSPREPRSQEGVDHSLRGASTKRSEPHAGQRKGQSKSSDQPTWADKLKTPNGTRPPATNTPPAPDPRDQELRALRVEVSRLTTLLTQSPTPPSPPSQQLSPEQVTPPTAQSPNSPATHSSPPLKKKHSSDSVDDYQADLRNLEAKFDAKLVALEARIEAKFSTIVEQLSTRFEQQMDALFTRLTQTLETRFTQFETRLQRLETTSSSHEGSSPTSHTHLLLLFHFHYSNNNQS
ncbi:hypothetical protein HPB51_015211 [Rhipicephalus microplus]|uniref:Tick transposon n=1 Tax=Rhipicephalus microplus TaxID=6941 RepID=A0A9J6EAF4_RHIMP|nr:hypothetical protein HPB51_015211 [Rhipicephalus microplus]